MASEVTSTVHFCSIPEIVEIPRRSIWRRKLKPFKDRCCSVLYTVLYFLCYPCVEVFRFCSTFCKLWKVEDNPEPEVRRDQNQRRDSRSLYAQGVAGPAMMYGPYAAHSGTTIKQSPQLL